MFCGLFKKKQGNIRGLKFFGLMEISDGLFCEMTIKRTKSGAVYVLGDVHKYRLYCNNTSDVQECKCFRI